MNYNTIFVSYPFPHPSGPTSRNGCLWLDESHGVKRSSPRCVSGVCMTGDCGVTEVVHTHTVPSLQLIRTQTARGGVVVRVQGLAGVRRTFSGPTQNLNTHSKRRHDDHTTTNQLINIWLPTFTYQILNQWFSN